jgi:hypothetical protein
VVVENTDMTWFYIWATIIAIILGKMVAELLIIFAEHLIEKGKNNLFTKIFGLK